MAGGLTLLTGTAASIPTPAAGKVTIFLDTATGLPSYKDDLGVVRTFTGPTGAAGPIGPVMLLEDGLEGEQGIPGPQGIAGSGGGGSSALTVAQIIVPHASIIASSTPIELIAAPGAGKLLIPVAMRTVKETTAGAYATNPIYSIRYDGVATDLSTAQSITITAADKRLRNFNITDFNITSPPFNTRIMWRGSADTTSGNTANYIVVQVVYSVITDGP